MLTLNKVLMASALAMMTLTRSNVADLVNCTRQGDPTLGSGGESASLGYPNHSACPAGTRCLRSNSYQWGNAATPSAQTTSNPWQYACYECANNCDCKPGYYCSGMNPFVTSAPGIPSLPTYGKCLAIPKINTRCNPDLTSTSATIDLMSNVDTTQSYTNGSSMFCGIIESGQVYVGSSTTSTLYNVTSWKGVCVSGYCKECNSALLVGSSSDVTVTDIAGSVKTIWENDQGQNTLHCTTHSSANSYFNTYQGIPTTSSSSDLGMPRYCQNYKFVAAGSAEVAGLSSGHKTMTSGLYLMMITLISIYLIVV